MQQVQQQAQVVERPVMSVASMPPPPTALDDKGMELAAGVAMDTGTEATSLNQSVGLLPNGKCGWKAKLNTLFSSDWSIHNFTNSDY